MKYEYDPMPQLSPDWRIAQRRAMHRRRLAYQQKRRAVNACYVMIGFVAGGLFYRWLIS